MQRKSSTDSPAPFSRMIPTRPAAVALLLLDAALIVPPLFIRWQMWFAFAYVPLLITVALGAMMSGRARLAAIVTAIIIPVLQASLWAAVTFLSPATNVLGTILRAEAIALACLGAFWFCIAAWGWAKFFAGRPAAE